MRDEFDEVETIDRNPKSWVAWKREAERLQGIIDGMALAAMNSEPVALQPELAKVIYHFRDWNEGFPVERFKADYVISWMLANYPPAPPAPVVSADLLHTAASAIEDLLTTKDRTGACVWFDLPFRLRSAANAQPAPVVPVENHIGSKNALDAIVSFIKGKSNPTVKCYEEVSEQLFKDNCHGIHSHVIEYILKLGEELEDLRAEQAEMQPVPVVPVCTCRSGDGSLRWPCPLHPGNSPLVPDGIELVANTLEHIGNFADAAIIRQLAANQPQNAPQNIPEIIPGWIQVSEQMPEDRTQVILWDAEIGEVTSGHYSHKTQTFYHCGDAIENEITHWMPPPCAPQEVKGEHQIRDEMDMGARITSHRFKV